MAYSYKRTETVQSGQITGTLTDFPALFSRTHNDFRVVGSGGHVQSAPGYDLNLFADSAGSPGAMLDMETEYYNSATGQVVKWARVPSIAVGTVVHWQYGDSGISTSQDNAAGVWPSPFEIVTHGGDGSTVDVHDSTANARNGFNSGTSAATGQIRGAWSFTSASNYVTWNDQAFVDGLSAITLSSWWKFASIAAGKHLLGKWGGGADQAFALFSDTGGAEWLAAFQGSGTYQIKTTTNASMTTGVWYLLHTVFTSPTTVAFYVNGSARTFSTQNNDPITGLRTGTASDIRSGAQPSASDAPLATVCEMRIRSGSISAATAEAEYNNQSAPTSFWGLGSENPVSSMLPFRTSIGGKRLWR